MKAWLGNIVPASPSVTPGGANLALGYTPALPTAAPLLLSDVMQLQNATIGNGTFGCPYPKLKLSRDALTGASPVKWYRRGTAYDDTLEVQGSVYLSSNDLFSARPLSVLVEYEVEFRTPSDPANTVQVAEDPDPVTMQRQIAELQRVLGIDVKLVKRPAPISVGADEAKEPDDYVRVNESAPEQVVSVFQPAVNPPVKAPGRVSVPSTPASARRF